MPAASGSRGAGSRWLRPMVIAGLILAALNLRPAVTSLGPLLKEVRSGLGMSGAVAGLLTSVPALCFALFGFAAPRLARRWGPGMVVCAGMAAITAGLVLRPFAGGTPAFLAASALALAGIAVSNVLMPVIVKRYFPDRVGPMTGVYSMAMAVGTAAAAATTVPLTQALGGSWRLGLGVWAVLGVLAVLPWTAIARDRTRPDRDLAGRSRSAGGGAAGTPASGTASAGAASGTSSAGAASGASSAGAVRAPIIRSATAWAMAVFFGLQATGAYITMGWMPQIFRDAGMSASTSGVLLAVIMLVSVPLSFLLPRIAARLRSQSPLVVLLGLFGLTGYAGLYLAPAAGAWAWALLIGLSNCAFPLALTMIGMRARTSSGVIRLSAFAQSTGYLIAIPGPLLVGVLYQHSGGWGQPIALMAALMVPQVFAGVLAGRDRVIEDEV
ncbi:CynX/NimT family MFS transporter [Streptomyces varsoviensis]